MELTLEQALQKGIEAHKAGKVQEADRYYTAIIKANAKHPDANHNMGVLAVGIGKIEEALPFFKTALEATSGVGQYWLSYIDALIKLDRIEDAKVVLAQAKSSGAKGDSFDQIELKLTNSPVEVINQTHKDIPTGPNILDQLNLDKALKLANEKVKDGLSEEAKKIYQNILENFPQNEKALDGIRKLTSKKLANTSDMGEVSKEQLQSLVNLYTQGQLKEALNQASQLLEKFPNSINLYNIIGAVNKNLGKLSDAIEAYKKAISINPDFADAYYNMANALKDQGKLEEGIEVYKKALSIKPEFAEAYFNLGSALKDQGKLEEAIEAYNKALSIKPDYAEAYFNLGNALKDQGNLEEAIEAYTKALSIKPEFAEACLNLGNALKDQGKLEEGIEIYKKALSVNPNYAEVYFDLGNALLDQGKPEEAKEVYKRALSINPDYAEAYYNLGISLKDQGKPEEAIEAYNKALSIKPDYFEAWNNMGNSLKDQGKLEEALEVYKKALSINPDYAEAYNNMGNAFQEQGKLEEAIMACNKALSIKPDYLEAWNNLYFPLQAIKYQKKSNQNLTRFYPKDINSTYSEIQLNILDYTLHRGQESEGIYLDRTIKSLSDAENISIKNPTFDENTQEKINTLPNKVVALVHFGRSGTGLLHSLIDGHSKVSTLPSIYFAQYFDHSTWVKLISDGWDGMIDRFIAAYEVLFDASSSVPVETKSRKLIYNIGKKEGMANVGDQRNEILKVDKDLFREELKRTMASYNALDSFIFFKLVHSAYNTAINDCNSKSLIFYHIHNPNPYAQLNFAGFNPAANFLFMVREPIQSCESWITRNVRDNNYPTVATQILTMLFDIDNSVYSRQNAVGVRLEDLKTNQRKTIPALCKWMGIEQNDSLYEMTAQGKKWWGDPSSPDFKKDGHDPFGKTSIKRKVGSIFSENDQFILRTLFYPFSVRFGYTKENNQQFKNDLETIRPMLDSLFDFEKLIIAKTETDPELFMKSGSYLYLRSGLIERWNILNKYQTYPNMIKPLKIETDSII